MPRLFLPLILPALCIALLVGCKKDEKLDNLTVPRLMLETRGVNYGSIGSDTVTLPVSGSKIQLQKKPVVNEFEIANVEMVKVDMGMAMLVQMTGKGARDLYRASVSHMGGRIVLTVNGNAIGARRIDSAIEDGNLYTFVEVDDAELGQLVLDIKDSLARIRSKE